MGSLKARTPRKKVFRYCLSRGTELGRRFGESDDESTCYEIYFAQGDTLCDFLYKMQIEEVDAKNRVVATFDFFEAPLSVQCAVLRLTGLTWPEVHSCEPPAQEKKKTASVKKNRERELGA